MILKALVFIIYEYPGPLSSHVDKELLTAYPGWEDKNTRPNHRVYHVYWSMPPLKNSPEWKFYDFPDSRSWSGTIWVVLVSKRHHIDVMCVDLTSDWQKWSLQRRRVHGQMRRMTWSRWKQPLCLKNCLVCHSEFIILIKWKAAKASY